LAKDRYLFFNFLFIYFLKIPLVFQGDIHWVLRGEKEKPKCIPLLKILGPFFIWQVRPEKGDIIRRSTLPKVAAKGRRWILGTPHPRGLTVSNDLQEILQRSNGQDKMAGSFLQECKSLPITVRQPQHVRREYYRFKAPSKYTTKSWTS
jgi:hypothetical protein